MIAPLSKPTVKLIGQDGNAFAIMGTVKQGLKRAGADSQIVTGWTWFGTGKYDI
jgi:hypothetical protein